MELTILVQHGVSIILTALASTGFWAWAQKKTEKKSASSKLLMGMARDRIIFLGQKYVNRGYLSKDEYYDLLTYFYDPYIQFGGNGLAEKIMEQVNTLPLVQAPVTANTKLTAGDINNEAE